MKRLAFITLCITMVIGGRALAQEAALVSLKVLSPETALQLAQATLANCRAKGFQVAVAVVDRMGVTQVVLRDRYAGPHTPDTATRKGWTAVSFRSDTGSLAENTTADTPQSGAREIAGALMLGGGLTVEAAGSIVGGVGVSGAPTGADDAACARAGIEAIRDKLEF